MSEMEETFLRDHLCPFHRPCISSFHRCYFRRICSSIFLARSAGGSGNRPEKIDEARLKRERSWVAWFGPDLDDRNEELSSKV